MKYEKHGMRYTRIYRIWCGMKNRCDCVSSKDYKNYGAKGIGYQKSWSKFSNFYKDMGEEYSDNLTLDRIDNNKGYSNKNCRWATIKTQNNNRNHGWRKRERDSLGRFI